MFLYNPIIYKLTKVKSFKKKHFLYLHTPKMPFFILKFDKNNVFLIFLKVSIRTRRVNFPLKLLKVVLDTNIFFIYRKISEFDTCAFCIINDVIIFSYTECC
ncbi:hypothetical protein EDEG_04114 [Edhazardia aedis USNM 41457]|uniref:Uncharacterized protein n=1 Tax=Edhazardia aedis (strain USNM 41457) TaxID=1003232 RepID=J8ZZS6_EDHAE|nr:hypothetical protein EDEG_04114 [Edhazardia aedis USNM 41457]|eukprot:EJW05138.1 hypothetical protein EDEG_04114 [Edhazardia aedis USNM 41457]